MLNMPKSATVQTRVFGVSKIVIFGMVGAFENLFCALQIHWSSFGRIAVLRRCGLLLQSSLVGGLSVTIMSPAKTAQPIDGSRCRLGYGLYWTALQWAQGSM